ncbi:MAG TPA: CBS domain-containing protein [Anaeromyxobacteraceae bacterium]|nr:CBS domain-containing protein [Anaeromyxobacteraceae bacterium]
MLVRDAMTPHAETVAPGNTLQEAALKMRTLNVGALPVQDGASLVGIVTDRDIVIRAVANGLPPLSTPVSEAMTPQSVWCFDDQDTLEAARIMEAMAIRRLMVLDRDRKLVGMITVDDIAAVARQERVAGQVIDHTVVMRPVPA